MREYLMRKQEEDRKEEEKRKNRLYGAGCAVMFVLFWVFCAAGISGVF